MQRTYINYFMHDKHYNVFACVSAGQVTYRVVQVTQDTADGAPTVNVVTTSGFPTAAQVNVSTNDSKALLHLLFLEHRSSMIALSLLVSKLLS